jgi:hypothetical protein
MSRTQRKSLLIFLLTVGALTNANSQTQLSKQASIEPCPDRKTYTGKYRNLNYGFSIVIPRGLRGHWNSARCVPDEKIGCVCMGDHGRFIPLAEKASIEAFVGYEVDPEWSLRDYEREDISSIRKDPDLIRVKVLSTKPMRLDRLRARRFVVQFVEKNHNVVIDHIIALHQGVEYELILRTSAERLVKDEKQLAKVFASWRLTRRL